jgi:hypothetical protein
MQEDVAGQELYTRDHGTVKVETVSFMDGGYHIVKCPNGTYMHSNGLPVKDEKELRAAIPQPFLQDALNWFKNRFEHEANPPRPIGFHGDGYPVFPDGTVPDFDDLYAYFKPGPILTAAIVALQDYRKRKETGKPPKELRQAKAEVKADPAGPGTVTAPQKEAAPAKSVLKKGKKGTRKTGKSKSTVIHQPPAAL